MAFDLEEFLLARQHDSDHALLLACLAEMEGGTSGVSSLEATLRRVVREEIRNAV